MTLPINPSKSSTRRTTSSPPAIKHNGAEAWLRRYLNGVSDWRTFLSAGSLEKQAAGVTGTYFGAQALKSAAFLFGVHLSQQVSASAASLVLRTWVRGSRLADHRGIAIRQFQPLTLRRPDAQTQKLGREWRIFWTFSGLKSALTRAGHTVQVHDHYFFTEGGRSWLCYTLRFPTREPNRADRALTVLTLLGFPNKGYYLDRTLPFNTAVDLTRGHVNADSVPGFIGDVNELDILMPLIRLAKLALYGLNWYLVDPEERDGPAPDVAGYNNLIPPTGSQGSGKTRASWRVKSRAARRSPGRAAPPASWYGYVGQQPGSGWNAPPPSPAPPAQTSFLPQNSAAANLLAAPVEALMTIENAQGQRQETWITVEENAYAVLDPYNRPTGLAISPAITMDSAGEFALAGNQWHIIHTGTGKLLTTAPLPDVYQARQLAARLLGVGNWTAPVEQMTQAQREQVYAILNGSAAPAPNPNGYSPFSF